MTIRTFGPHLAAVCLVTCLLSAGIAGAEEWNEGGTLHHAKARQWHAATYRNRLATSADFIAAADKASSRKQLLERSVGLERCITTATDDPALYDLKVREVAVLCLVLLEY